MSAVPDTETLAGVVDWLSQNVPMDMTGHVEACGIDETDDCACSTLPMRLAERDKAVRAAERERIASGIEASACCPAMEVCEISAAYRDAARIARVVGPSRSDTEEGES